MLMSYIQGNPPTANELDIMLKNTITSYTYNKNRIQAA